MAHVKEAVDTTCWQQGPGHRRAWSHLCLPTHSGLCHVPWPSGTFLTAELWLQGTGPPVREDVQACRVTTAGTLARLEGTHYHERKSSASSSVTQQVKLTRAHVCDHHMVHTQIRVTNICGILHVVTWLLSVVYTQCHIP